MRWEDIRPIPEEIAERIREADRNARIGRQKSITIIYAYYTEMGGDLCQIRVAAKHYRDQLLMKQVAVHRLHGDECLTRDMVFTYVAGYTVDWSAEAGRKPRRDYCHDWWQAKDFFETDAIDVNLDYVMGLDAYRYSAVDLAGVRKTRCYLREYEQHPIIELLAKCGIGYLYDSKKIVEKLEKDKGFRSFIFKNSSHIRSATYISAILSAYRDHITIDEAQRKETFKTSIRRMRNTSRMLRETGEYDRLAQYLSDQKKPCAVDQYEDYLTACLALGVDMADTKNRYPRDFRHWHDIRTAEYASLRAERDAKANKEFTKAFADVAGKYLALELAENEYLCVIAKAPADLVREGSYLHHCVGRMGYDQNFAREKSLIFFVRRTDEPTIPYVTIEYSPTERRVLQCYGAYNRSLDADTLAFVQKKWLPYANRQLKSITA